MRHKQFETHCLTAETSRCGVLTARQIVDGISRAGYAGTFVTDHFNARFFEKPGMKNLSWKAKTDRWLKGFRPAALRAKMYGLKVFLGLELQPKDSPYEFLIYGPDEKFLYDAGPFYNLQMADIYRLMHQNDYLVFQAHPYRYGLSPEDPSLFDGIEIVNAQPRHLSRNRLAMEFAFKHDVMIIAGGDVHMEEDIGKSGIMLPEDIGNVKEFIAYYKQVRRPELIVTYGA